MSAGDVTRGERSLATAEPDAAAAEPPEPESLVSLRYGDVSPTPGAEAASEPIAADVPAAGPAGGDAPTSVDAADVVGDAGDAGDASDPQADPCAHLRRTADERCSVAARAREHAEGIHRELRAAQLAYDEYQSRAEHASVAADPRTIRTAKEAAQHAFRASRAAARTPESVEAAARDWLTEINRINHFAREAALAATREREAAAQLVTRMERLTVEADGARILAEEAELVCLGARQELAECEEAETGARPAFGLPIAPSVGAETPVASTRLEDGGSLEDVIAASDQPPVVIRLLRGDRATLDWLVAELGGADPAERRRWQIALGGLLEAIIARAIDASALDFPESHPFWAPFTRDQARDIVGALASLSFRFDGLGGWVDDRVPSQRDLSLAVGYAGLDPMRIRQWPTEAETASLFRDVSVAADEYLVEAGGGLTLGELVSLLGRRADELTELWNTWGRVRPLLLAI